MPDDFFQNLPPIPGVSGINPPDTQSMGHIWPSGVDAEMRERDSGWLAQFYLRPNYYYFPNPSDMGMVGLLPLKLDSPKKVRGSRLPVCLYPDPTGTLAMVSVLGIDQGKRQAFEKAYDVVAPILDELSVTYDVPLPVVQPIIVGIPSGTISIFFPRHSTIRRIERSTVVEPRSLFPELRAAEALYREAMSSNNPFHRFLAFWKVYEEVEYVRVGWRQEHKRADVKEQDEVFPDAFAFGADEEQFALLYERDEDEPEPHDFRNESFHNAREHLNRPYRVALAHAGRIDGGKPLTAASGRELTRVSSQVPLARYMARVILENMRATLASSASETPQ